MGDTISGHGPLGNSNTSIPPANLSYAFTNQIIKDSQKHIPTIYPTMTTIPKIPVLKEEASFNITIMNIEENMHSPSPPVLPDLSLQEMLSTVRSNFNHRRFENQLRN